jgi:uncharacterized membrane protein HdeD (DUF308 family)
MLLPVLTSDKMWSQIVWSYFMGVLIALLGLFLIMHPLFTAALAPALLGGILILAGCMQFIFAIRSSAVGGIALKVLRSLLSGVAGGWLLLSPKAGVEAVTGVLMAMLLAGAGVEGVLAVVRQPSQGWEWFLMDGAASFLVAVLILAGWADSSVAAVGALVGLSVLMSGVANMMIASKIQGSVREIPEQVERRWVA